MYFSHNWEYEAKPISESREESSWCKYSDSQVNSAIEEGIERRDIRNAFDHTGEWIDKFGEKKEDILAIIRIVQESQSSFFDRFANRAEQLQIPTVEEIVESKRPTELETEDPIAKQQGIRIPPHISYYARALRSIRAAEAVLEMAVVVEKTIAQMERVQSSTIASHITGTKIL